MDTKIKQHCKEIIEKYLTKETFEEKFLAFEESVLVVTMTSEAPDAIEDEKYWACIEFDNRPNGYWETIRAGSTPSEALDKAVQSLVRKVNS